MRININIIFQHSIITNRPKNKMMDLDDIFEIDAKSGASSSYSQPPPQQILIRPIGMEHLVPRGGAASRAPPMDLKAMEDDLNNLSAGTSSGYTDRSTNVSSSAAAPPPPSVSSSGNDYRNIGYAANPSAPSASTASNVYSAIGSFFGGVAEDPLAANPAEWQRPPPSSSSFAPSSSSGQTTNNYGSQKQDRAEPYKSSDSAHGNNSSSYGNKPSAPRTDRLERKHKRKLLRNLRRLNEIDPIAYQITSTEASPIDEIEDELEMHDEDNKQKLGVDMIKYGFKGVVSTLEWVNQTWDPFSGALNIKGLNDVVTDKMAEFEPHFIEAQEKYKDIEIPTEIMIIIKLALAVGALNIANQYMANLASSDPNMSNIRNNPEVRRAVQAAAMQAYSPLAPPIETNNRPRPQNPNPLPGKPANYQPQYGTAAPAPRPPGGPLIFSSRPDMEYAKASADASASAGIDRQTTYASERDRSVGGTHNAGGNGNYSQPQRAESGVPLNSFTPYDQGEMSGPTEDVSLFLAGLKTSAPAHQASVPQPTYTIEDVDDNMSVASGLSFDSFGEGRLPSGPKKRRTKSARATIALNI